MEEHQPLPPRSNGPTLGGNQQQVIPNQAARQQDHHVTSSTNLYVLSLN
jgi:hypothetical protein